MIDQSDKQKKRVNSLYSKYNEEFVSHLLISLINCADLNLKGIVRVISSGNYAHIKKRENIRLLRDFALKGVMLLRDEKEAVQETETFELLMVKYYEYSLKFCLN